MKTYQDIGQAIKEIKRPLKWLCVGAIVLNTLILALSYSINLGKDGHRQFTTVEACFYGMREIFNNAPTENLVNKKVIEDIAKHKMVFSVERIHLVKFNDSFSCDVVSKDLKGVRSFKVMLEKNSRFNHGYRILDISEQKITSRYQR